MYYNYLKIAWRNILKYKGYSFINSSGLTVGITVCLLLFLWVKDELSYDQFHDNADRIYRLQWEGKYGDNSWTIPKVPMPLAPMMENTFPEVELATQVFDGRFTVEKDGEYIRENDVLFVDQKFFDVFSIKTLAGNTKEAITNTESIIITDKTAERYFDLKGQFQQAIGKTITRNDGKEMYIASVVESFPTQSHLQFSFLAPIDNVQFLKNRKDKWSFASVLSYFLMDKKGDPDALANKLQKYVDENLANPDDTALGNYSRYPFEPVASIHITPNLSYIWMFGIIGVFILLLACVNFINLTTARAMTRAREVGIRKVLGSRRSQLIQQFFSESTLYVFGAVLFAIVLARLLLPTFNEFTDKSLQLDLLNSLAIWGILVGLIIFTALLTGAFPAFVLSAFSPVKVIKGQLTKSQGKDRLRQGLVIFQFCISSALIIGTLVVNDQLHYLQKKQLGFDKDQVMIIRSASGLRSNYQVFLDQLRKKTWIDEVSIAQYLPGDPFDSTIFVPEQPSNYQQTSLSYCHIDDAFVDALKVEIVEGRNFDLAITTDSTACLINETAAKRLGWENPIGKNLSYGGFTDSRVIGVVKDFNFNSLHEEIEPLVLRLAKFNLPNIFIRLQGGDLQKRIQTVSKEWQELAPTVPFEFAFLDDEIQQMYESEQRMSAVFSSFALLAIFIACLGLFGLAAFMAEQRSKEIGIRKVLGASFTGIVGLLSKDFLQLVFIALVLAIPLSYYFLEQWLTDFAYRINIEWWIFALAGFIAFMLALITISVQSIKAALVNPIESLRNE